MGGFAGLVYWVGLFHRSLNSTRGWRVKYKLANISWFQNYFISLFYIRENDENNENLCWFWAQEHDKKFE